MRQEAARRQEKIEFQRNVSDYVCGLPRLHRGWTSDLNQSHRWCGQSGGLAGLGKGEAGSQGRWCQRSSFTAIRSREMGRGQKRPGPSVKLIFPGTGLTWDRPPPSLQVFPVRSPPLPKPAPPPFLGQRSLGASAIRRPARNSVLRISGSCRHGDLTEETLALTHACAECRRKWGEWISSSSWDGCLWGRML